MKKSELCDLAEELVEDLQLGLSASEVEDAVSICKYVSDQYGEELTLKEGEFVRKEMDKLEG